MDRRSVLLALLALPTVPLASFSGPSVLPSLASASTVFGPRVVAAPVTDALVVDRTREFLGVLHSLANGRDVEKIWDDWFGWSSWGDEKRTMDGWNAETMFYSLLHEPMYDRPSAEMLSILEGMRARPSLLEKPMITETYVASEPGYEDYSQEVAGVQIDDVAVMLSESGEAWSLQVGSTIFQGGV